MRAVPLRRVRTRLLAIGHERELRPSSPRIQCGRAPILPACRMRTLCACGSRVAGAPSGRAVTNALRSPMRPAPDGGVGAVSRSSERHAPLRSRVATTSLTARTSCSARPAPFNNARRAGHGSSPSVSARSSRGSPGSARHEHGQNGASGRGVGRRSRGRSRSRRALARARALRWHLFHIAARLRGAQDACPDARRWARELLLELPGERRLPREGAV